MFVFPLDHIDKIKHLSLTISLKPNLMINCQISFLKEYTGYIKDWNEEGKTVYIHFNNTIGDALENLQTLNRHLSQIPVQRF
ncbi:hypothetical protein D3C85_1765620 [compost metagenome]